MNKKVIMIIAIPIMVIAFVAIVGLSSAYLCNKDDGPIEEMAESILESKAEYILGVDDNTFRFDLTPDSKELGQVAMVKIQDAWCREHCLNKDKEMDE